METSIVFGRRPVLEYLRSGQPVNRLYVLAGAEGIPRELFRIAKEREIPTVRCDRQRLDSLARKGNHQGVAAQTASREFDSWQEILESTIYKEGPPLILALDGVQDPGNFGALLRTAEGAGVNGVVVTARASCGLTPAVTRAAAGADAYIKVARVDRLDRVLSDLVKVGYQVVAANPQAELDYDQLDLRKATVFVLGAEGEGLSRQVEAACTVGVRLPLRGQVDSLNVSATGAILLYEALRQRKKTE
ncbi:MAG: 23S rRNA (guanosine(2251)-2'-O)-methyltransferase RlmB [Vulcanimicrobiota bacterium]